MKTMKMKLGAVALVGCALLWALPAHADTVMIGLQQVGVNGDAVTTVATNPGSAIFSGSYGTFSLNNVSGVGQSNLVPPSLLLSNSIQAATTTAGQINVFISDLGLTSPLGTPTLSFDSSFTSNVLPAGWTLSEETFISPANMAYGGTVLGSHTFTAIGTNTQTASATTGPGPYSVTELYIIVAPNPGNANSTIDLSTPEPSSILLLGAGLVGLVLFPKRNRLSNRG